MTWDIERMRRETADLTRDATIGYLRRKPGNIDAALARLMHAPDGQPADYPTAVDRLAAYGAYLVAAADVLRDKPPTPPRMVKLVRRGR